MTIGWPEGSLRNFTYRGQCFWNILDQELKLRKKLSKLQEKCVCIRHVQTIMEIVSNSRASKLDVISLHHNGTDKQASA